jgi:hypothetical protein
MVVKVIADTSFLMIPGMFGVDILSETERVLEDKPELVVPTPVLGELKRLSVEGKPRERAAANVGIKIAESGERVRVDPPADRAILTLAVGMKCHVGTTDATLRKELRHRGIPVIYLRGKSHLAIDGCSEV